MGDIDLRSNSSEWGWADKNQVNGPILEKKRCPGFCLLTALQLLLEKAGDEKRHLVLNSLQHGVALIRIMVMRRTMMTGTEGGVG